MSRNVSRPTAVDRSCSSLSAFTRGRSHCMRTVDSSLCNVRDIVYAPERRGRGMRRSKRSTTPFGCPIRGSGQLALQSRSELGPPEGAAASRQSPSDGRAGPRRGRNDPHTRDTTKGDCAVDEVPRGPSGQGAGSYGLGARASVRPPGRAGRASWIAVGDARGCLHVVVCTEDTR